jgi:hypothetical protein
MWNKLRRLFKREADYAQLDPIYPKVAPDPEVAARLLRKQSEYAYAPEHGFLWEKRQEKKR